MNSADVHQSTKSDPGMEVYKPYRAADFKGLTPGEGKEPFLRSANLGNPEVRDRLDSIDAPGSTGLMKQRMVFSIPQSLGSHGLADG
jgi:hypothetical protein